MIAQWPGFKFILRAVERHRILSDIQSFLQNNILSIDDWYKIIVENIEINKVQKYIYIFVFK